MSAQTPATAADPFKPHLLPLALMVAVALYFAAGTLPFDGESYRAQMAAAITGFVAVCWLTNLISLGAASLMPLALMPMTGVLPIDEASSAYAHPVIWMFFGGFVLALGIERWGLHRRLALNIVTQVGAHPSRLVLGFSAAAAAISRYSLAAAAEIVKPLYLPSPPLGHVEPLAEQARGEIVGDGVDLINFGEHIQRVVDLYISNLFMA